MKKGELAAAMAEAAGISRATALKALDGAVAAIGASLQGGDEVRLTGFGTFTVRDRAARTARNPRTGESIEVAASRVPAFKASRTLKDAIW